MKKELLEQLGIELRTNKGTVKTTCPKCTTERKNKNDKSLSVNIDEGLYNCHHCGWKGRVYDKPKKIYTKPEPRLQKVGDKVLKFFTDRGITNNTLLRFGITEAKEWMPQFDAETAVICFNYYRLGELVNIKFRGAKKAFKMAKDAELIFYNIDAIQDESECIIVEGEMDCLAVYEAGFYNCVSVPNGASKGNQKLEYLDNCFEYFANKTKVILMTDADEAGYQLRDELARRIGKEKCFKVEYPADCKDANDILLKYGKERLQNAVKEAKELPIEGIIGMDEVFEDVVRLYEHGYPEGIRLNIGEFDEHLRLYKGQLTIVTGIPGSGKSEFVDMIACKTIQQEGWKWGIFGFETPTQFHVTRLAEKLTGKAFGFRKDPLNRMTVQAFEKAVGIIDQNCFFVNIDEVDVSIDGIIEKAEQLVIRKGIQGVIIDPWNYVEQRKDRSQTETEYISETLTKLKRFLKRYDLHCFLIAHPTKLRKEGGKYEVPTMYSISGSAHFFNKTDNGITVYRDFETNNVDVHIQKVKNYWLGKLGCVTFMYDTETRQYINL
jgi:twinkle protein